MEENRENISPEDLAGLYVELHNSGVETGDFSEMLKLFARDAEMSFKNIEAGPFTGLDSISKAFSDSPPDDRLHIFKAEKRGKSVILEYGWQSDPEEERGSIVFTFSNGLIKSITVI